MRFEDAYEGWQDKRLTQEQAAQLLGVCERSFRRYIDRDALKLSGGQGTPCSKKACSVASTVIVAAIIG